LSVLAAEGKPAPVVRVYQLVSVLAAATPATEPTLDQIMYETSENKDVKMKQIEHIVKTHAFDCPLAVDRNRLVGFDGLRECDYTSCDYTCDGKIGNPLDLTTYELYHAAVEKLYERLASHFRTSFSISLTEITKWFPDMTKSTIVASVRKLIDGAVQFRNRHGFVSFLRIQESDLYITSDPRVLNDSKLLTYYSQNLLIQNGDTFEHIIKRLTENRLPSAIATIFSFPAYTRTLVATVPAAVQRLLLQSCIEAHIRDAQANVEVRNTILDMFKGFFTPARAGRRWVVWLFKEEFGVTFFNPDKDDLAVGPEYTFPRPTGVWELMDDTVAVEQQIRKKRLRAVQSPIGVYGLYNPHLDEFCLRVSNETNTTDLRKIAIGRRCGDWDLKALVDIIARRIRQDPPTDFLLKNGALPSLNQLKEKASAIRKQEVFITKDFSDPEQLRRVLFWANSKRAFICQQIRKWLEAAGLVEENFDCGTQKKQRAKFAVVNA
jgi:hypothetical protein